MTIPYPLPPRVVHTHHHEEEVDKRQSSCCIIHVVAHTIRPDQETVYIMYNTTTRLTLIHLLLMVMGMYNPGRKWVWNSHIYTASWSYLIVCSTTCIIQQLDWRLSTSSSWWRVCTTLGGSGYGIVIYTLFPGLIYDYSIPTSSQGCTYPSPWGGGR
jgi:hypothetical protein